MKSVLCRVGSLQRFAEKLKECAKQTVTKVEDPEKLPSPPDACHLLSIIYGTQKLLFFQCGSFTKRW
jgi:hypothetical protein